MNRLGRRRTTFLAFSLLLTAVCAHVARAQTAPQKYVVRADDGHSLVVWAKVPKGDARGEILLLHGRTWSSLPNFDLRVPGVRVSLMDALVTRGYAVYALDQRGYGATTRDATGWLTPNRAADDATNVLDWIAERSPGNRRAAMLGYSRGSVTGMLAAQRHPDKLSALVLYGFPANLDKMPSDPLPEPKSPPRDRTTAEGAAEDFITPESTPAGVKDAYVRAATKSDPVRVDWRREVEELMTLDPGRIQVPVLLINGERDPYVAEASLETLFPRFGAADRWWIVLAKADHVAHLERQTAFVQALTSFLERPR
jgi:pimeloyl-ACP methyl ester carboxylesterase